MSTDIEVSDREQAKVQRKVDQAFKIEQRIIKSIQKGNELSWALAKDLYTFHEEGGWTLLGYDTIEEWLAQPNIGLKRSTFFRMTQLYRKLAIEREVSPERLSKIDYTKAQVVLPALSRGDITLEEGLSDTETLGKLDLRRKYSKQNSALPGEHTTNPNDDPLDADAEPALVQCPVCASWVEPDKIEGYEVVDA